MVLDGQNVRKIHKKIYEITIKQPKMFIAMTKIANKMAKTYDRRKTADENSAILLLLMSKMDVNGKIKKLINHEVSEEAEKSKNKVVKSYINESRSAERWIYLASSHNDCAIDHQPYQGKLYYDANAPEDIKKWAENKGLFTIQWVMDEPAYFITRPNCRHFFKSLPIDVVKKYGIKELQRRYKTHRMTGDTRLKTPKIIAVEEYKDRFNLLKSMYSKHPTETLRREINKIKLLLKKWENKL